MGLSPSGIRVGEEPANAQHFVTCDIQTVGTTVSFTATIATLTYVNYAVVYIRGVQLPITMKWFFTDNADYH